MAPTTPWVSTYSQWYTVGSTTSVSNLHYTLDNGTANATYVIPTVTWGPITETYRRGDAEDGVAAERREADMREAQRRYEERRVRERVAAEDAQRVAREARTRAERTLLAAMTDEQRESYLTRGAFRVVGEDGKTYEVRRGRIHNVEELDAEGRQVVNYCITHGEIPDEDILLAQKMLLEGNIATFKRIANATRRAA